jgi:OmpA-OmpF porin, OOP family
MRRYLLVVAPAMIIATEAMASAPPSIWFEPGSARLRVRDHFAFDQAELEARAIGAEAFCIVASADRMGSRSYNLRLSRRRAEAVKQELVRRGFRANAIVVRARGEDRGLVETADGLAEANNRFAMIFYGRDGCPVGT